MASVTRQPDKQDLYSASIGMARPAPEEDEISEATWGLPQQQE